MKNENFEAALDEIVWLITLLANQGILTHNLRNRHDQSAQKPLLTEDDVELLTTPFDLKDYKSAITEAMQRGTNRTVESEDEEGKNAGGA